MTNNLERGQLGKLFSMLLLIILQFHNGFGSRLGKIFLQVTFTGLVDCIRKRHILFAGGHIHSVKFGRAFGIKQFCSIINPPQSSILTVGSGKMLMQIRNLPFPFIDMSLGISKHCL
ncbi:unnamed protein product [Fraxinus pennsylvanica]|uniref:Uncharacterized protein n=1 Tax=Fraxinus pennsylvanica TaxID=56036 RepID=A0AAD1ZH86_9LAMI|nr:unnamed protein product [Fraxinus pennsylvanica]